jgi:hypothetical protein
MTMIMLETRADWDARPPTAVTRLDWSKVTKFIVHYSGASRAQTVRSIQNFCMDVKGHSDIDYNELVRKNVLYVGRGNNVGSHTLGNNSTSYGVCMIGVDGDATADDLNVIRMRYDYACAMAGRTLAMLGHNQAPGLPAGYTACPGTQIQTWINAGMPFMEDGDMSLTPLQDAQNSNSEHYLQSIVGMTAQAEHISNVSRNDLVIPNLLTKVLLDIQAKVNAGGTGTGITEDRLREIIREELNKTKLTS